MNILYFVLFFFFLPVRGCRVFDGQFLDASVRLVCLLRSLLASLVLCRRRRRRPFLSVTHLTPLLLLLLLLPLSVVCVFLLRCKLSRSTIPSAIVSFLHRLLCLYPPPLHPRLVSPLFICSHATSPPKNAFSIPRPRCISKYLPMLLLHCTVLFPPVSILFSFCFSPVSFFYLSPATPNPHLYYTTTKYFFLPVASS